MHGFYISSTFQRLCQRVLPSFLDLWKQGAGPCFQQCLWVGVKVRKSGRDDLSLSQYADGAGSHALRANGDVWNIFIHTHTRTRARTHTHTRGLRMRGWWCCMLGEISVHGPLITALLLSNLWKMWITEHSVAPPPSWSPRPAADSHWSSHRSQWTSS